MAISLQPAQRGPYRDSALLVESANLTQSAYGIWKKTDTADAYCDFEIALGAKLTESLQLKGGFIGECKRKPPCPGSEPNDLAAVAQIELSL